MLRHRFAPAEDEQHARRNEQQREPHEPKGHDTVKPSEQPRQHHEAR